MYLKNHITFHGDKPSTISCLASAGSRTLLKVIAVSAVGTAISQGLTSCIFFRDRFADVLEQYGCVTQNGPKMNIPGCTWVFFSPQVVHIQRMKGSVFALILNCSFMTSLGGKLVHPFPSPSTSNATFSIQQAPEKLLRCFRSPHIWMVLGVQKTHQVWFIWIYINIYLDNIWIIFGKSNKKTFNNISNASSSWSTVPSDMEDPKDLFFSKGSLSARSHVWKIGGNEQMGYCILLGTITYPWGNSENHGLKKSSKVPAGKGYVSSQQGRSLQILVFESV